MSFLINMSVVYHADAFTIQSVKAIPEKVAIVIIADKYNRAAAVFLTAAALFFQSN